MVTTFAAVTTFATGAYADSTEASGATLSWRVSEQVWTASSLQPEHGVEAPATLDEVAWHFSGGTGTYDPDTGATSLAFSGALSFGNHTQGNYGFRFADPVFTVGADGVGTLTVDLSTRGPGGAPPAPLTSFGTPIPDITVATFTVAGATVTDGHVEMTIQPDFILRTDLTPENNPNEFRQFPQSLVSILSGAFLGHFRQTAVNQGVKAPSPITIAFDFEGEDPNPSGSQNIVASIVEQGDLSITVAGDTVILPPSVVSQDGQWFETSGPINAVTVTDLRPGSPGWNVSGQASAFTGPSGTFGSENLGWTPSVGSTSVGQVVTAGDPVAPGVGLASARTLAASAPGVSRGAATLGADLALRVPVTVAAGTYTSVLTLTVI